MKDKKRAEILDGIAQDEKAHYDFWKTLTGKDVGSDKGKISFFLFICRVETM